MKKIAVVYWSGTGNTEAMARAVAEGINSTGNEAVLVSVEKAVSAMLDECQALALSCPSMGDEVLEEDNMEPFVANIEGGQLNGKAIALFGSYDWGDGAWMRDWEARMIKAGAKLAAPGLIVQLSPGPGDLDQCRNLGKSLAGA